jgi:hypothetical protein
VTKINIIRLRDVTITIGVIPSHIRFNDPSNIVTSPFTRTSLPFFKWTVTIEFRISFWTVISSPVVFIDLDTEVIFTHSKGIIVIEITLLT